MVCGWAGCLARGIASSERSSAIAASSFGCGTSSWYLPRYLAEADQTDTGSRWGGLWGFTRRVKREGGGGVQRRFRAAGPIGWETTRRPPAWLVRFHSESCDAPFRHEPLPGHRVSSTWTHKRARRFLKLALKHPECCGPLLTPVVPRSGLTDSATTKCSDPESRPKSLRGARSAAGNPRRTMWLSGSGEQTPARAGGALVTIENR